MHGPGADEELNRLGVGERSGEMEFTPPVARMNAQASGPLVGGQRGTARFSIIVSLIHGCLSYPLSNVSGMESRTETTEIAESADAAGGGCAAYALLVWRSAALSDSELVERMTLLGHQRSRVEAMLAETAAEMQRRVGGRATAAVMRERLHVSSRQATADTALAAELCEQFPATLQAWRGGEITAGHARVIARVGADPDHADEGCAVGDGSWLCGGHVRAHDPPIHHPRSVLR